MIDIYRVNCFLLWMELVGVPGVPLHRTPSSAGATFANKTGPETPESPYSTPPRGAREDVHPDTKPMGLQAIRLETGRLSLRTRRTLIHHPRGTVAAGNFNLKSCCVRSSGERQCAQAAAAGFIEELPGTPGAYRLTPDGLVTIVKPLSLTADDHGRSRRHDHDPLWNGSDKVTTKAVN